MSAHAEGELRLADNRVLVFAKVIAEPEHEIRIDRRVEVEVHAEEFVRVVLDFGIRIVIFEAYAHAELLRDVEARFDGEEHLVFREDLVLCAIFLQVVALVDDGVEVVESQVEDAVVHARFDEEGVNGVALVRVQAVNGINAVVHDFEALGVVKFRTEGVTVTTADLGTEDPVHARGDGQVFVRGVQKLDGVATEDADRALAVVGGTDVDLAIAKLGVAEFDPDTAEGFGSRNDGVTVGIAPEVVIECTGVVGKVAEYKAYVLERSPAEFHTVKVECRIAVVDVVDGGRTGEAVADFRSAFGVREVALGVRVDRDGDFFVEICLHGQVDVLVCGVGRVKILVEIAGVVKIDFSVDFDVGGGCKTGSGKGNRQNEFTHTILLKKVYLIFYVQKIEISLSLDQCFVPIRPKIGICKVSMESVL